MGSFTDGSKFYKPATGETGWATLMNENLQRLSELEVNVKSFGAVGDGVADDTSAITDAIDYVAADGGTLKFPRGTYKVTSTIDLSGKLYINFVGEHLGSQGLVAGVYPPAVTINGTSITGGPVFDMDGGGVIAAHTWQNLVVRGGECAFHYFDTSNLRFNNVAATCQNTGLSGNNCSVILENSFWIWCQYIAFHGPTGIASSPALILRGTSGYINSSNTAIVKIANSTFWNGGISYQQNVDEDIAGHLSIYNTLTENSTHPFLRIVESNQSGTWRFHGLIIEESSCADSPTNPLPLVELDAANCVLDCPVLTSVQGVGERAIQVNSGSVNMAVITSARQASLITNAAGAATSGTSGVGYLSYKDYGFDLVTTPLFPTGVNGTGMLAGSGGGPAIRMAKSGEANARLGIDTDGHFYWGAGGATTGWDTELSRPAPNILAEGADDVFKTGQAATGSRPNAATVGAGAQFYDTTLQRPIWSNGTVWRDADGNTV